VKLFAIEDEKYSGDLSNIVEKLVSKPLMRSTLRDHYFSPDIDCPAGMVRLLLETDPKRLHPETYKPTFEDVLCIKDLKIRELPFRIKDTVYILSHTKGHYKNLTPVFKQTDTFIYVSNLTNYFTGKLAEDLNLFYDVTKDPINKDKVCILVLNGTDLLNYHHAMYPAKKYINFYNGPETFEAICKHIEGEFYKVQRYGVFVHYTCAFDREQFRKVARCISSIISEHKCICEFCKPNLSHKIYNVNQMKKFEDVGFRFEFTSIRKMAILGGPHSPRGTRPILRESYSFTAGFNQTKQNQ
jgi:hypothetical protein